ncbi:MAG: hypothetical protein JSS50_00075 [Proteobacteria bacterium]|nr:hypothetical protein [Pseudomonadota bacterium]
MAKPHGKPGTKAPLIAENDDEDNEREAIKEINKVEYGKSTGLPVPRFVALKSRETNWRNGPGHRYPIKWVYSQRGYPVQVIAEFEGWRKIRDVDGEDGWVHEALISGQRNAVVIANHGQVNAEANSQLIIYRKPDESSYPIAKLEFGVIVKLKKCQEKWCKVEAAGYNGWARRENLWGVMPDEIIK